MPDQGRDSCPNLAQILGAYLHQDFDLDYDSADAALLDAIASQDREQVERAAIELATYRPPYDNEGASQAFVNSLCSYHPPGDGLTYTAWLDHVQQRLRQATTQ